MCRFLPTSKSSQRGNRLQARLTKGIWRFGPAEYFSKGSPLLRRLGDRLRGSVALVFFITIPARSYLFLIRTTRPNSLPRTVVSVISCPIRALPDMWDGFAAAHSAHRGIIPYGGMDTANTGPHLTLKSRMAFSIFFRSKVVREANIIPIFRFRVC